MAVHIARSLNSSSAAYAHEGVRAALQGLIALLVVAVGLLGLLGDSWPQRMLESWINIHALFGLLLCGLVFARCQWFVRRSPWILHRDLGGLCRQLSRDVYLLAYLVIGLREVIGILNSLAHGGAVYLNPLGDGIHIQWFIASVLVALVFVRVLVFTSGRSAGEQPAVRSEHRVGVGK